MPIRALKIAVVAMGVLILLGTATLVVLIVRKAAGPLAAAGGGAAQELVMQEPEGTRIVGLAAAQDRIAVQLQGGGPDRVLLFDPRTLARTGTVRLAH